MKTKINLYIKYLFFLLVFCFNTIQAQTDTVCFTKNQVIAIATKAKEQKEKIATLEDLTIAMDSQIVNYELLRKNDSLYIQNMYYELNTYILLDSIHTDRIQLVEKDNRFKSKINKFLIGLVIIVGTIALAK